VPAAPVIKVIVTHRAAATRKYGATGWRRIRHAVTLLAAADKARGITTRFLALDSAADAKKVGGTKVSLVADSQGVKALIDRVYASWGPAYLVLLGGPDLVPQVALTNPLWTGNTDDDPDPFIASDLPYACDAAFSTTVSTYRGATRALGRIPDLMGVTDPIALLTQLAQAKKAISLSAASPVPVFALSTKSWVTSTTQSMTQLAGTTAPVRTSPAEGPVWTAGDLAPGLHFVNCHGGEFDPHWYGEAHAGQLNDPVSLQSSSLIGLITPGTVAAAECCYGAEHWPPAAAGGQTSVAMAYLLNGANGFFGASTTAYGPAASTAYADILCRMFLEEVIAGASLGRAVLTARQRYVQGQSFLDPTDLKTLGQFDLLGDPSIHPMPAASQPVPKGVRRAAATAKAPAIPAGVLARREVLTAVGDALAHSVTATNESARPRAALTRDRLAQLLGRALPPDTRIRSFDSTSEGKAVTARPRPVAHVAFVPPSRAAAGSLVVVRFEPGAEPELREVVRR
jgi:Peptidase family C25